VPRLLPASYASNAGTSSALECPAVRRKTQGNLASAIFLSPAVTFWLLIRDGVRLARPALRRQRSTPNRVSGFLMVVRCCGNSTSGRSQCSVGLGPRSRKIGTPPALSNIHLDSPSVAGA